MGKFWTALSISPSCLAETSMQTRDPNVNTVEEIKPVELPKSMYWMCGGVVDGMLPDIAVQGTKPLAGYDFLQLRTDPEKVGLVLSEKDSCGIVWLESDVFLVYF